MVELVDVGGYRLAISVSGAGSPPVVCVSGLTGDADEWSGVRAALRSQAMFFAYGRPGLGGSDPLPAPLPSPSCIKSGSRLGLYLNWQRPRFEILSRRRCPLSDDTLNVRSDRDSTSRQRGNAGGQRSTVKKP